MTAVIIPLPCNPRRSQETQAWDALMVARNRLHDDISGPLPMIKVETLRQYVKAYDAYMAEFNKNNGGAA